jgi:hypothetical protein
MNVSIVMFGGPGIGHKFFRRIKNGAKGNLPSFSLLYNPIAFQTQSIESKTTSLSTYFIGIENDREDEQLGW